MLVTFTVRHERAVSPVTPGLMVSRGYRLVLEPDRFPKHRLLVNRLRRSGAWTEDGVKPEDLKPVQTKAPEEQQKIDEVLPHQADIIAKIRNRASNPNQ
jgi:hypothetical protein